MTNRIAAPERQRPMMEIFSVDGMRCKHPYSGSGGWTSCVTGGEDAMAIKNGNGLSVWTRFGLLTLLGIGLVSGSVAAGDCNGHLFGFLHCENHCDGPGCATGEGEVGGTWYWLRSPEEEKRVVAALFNRYCIRCHGVDGRGVWDIPGVPNFTTPAWQSSRSDVQIVRIVLEGRGAVMPPFRGALNLEEAWGIARYIRTFVPGTEVSRPDVNQPAAVLPTPKSAPK
jgi:mono/diheme cytochrome c family protein